MELWEVRFEIAAAQASAADETLLELGQPEWSVLEDALARRAWVVGVFADPGAAEEGRVALAAVLPAAAAAPLQPLPDADWKNSYKAHFHPWSFGRIHWVPVWERGTFVLPPGHSVLWLDPGMAFGTGNHETTRLCIERLAEFERTLAPGALAGTRVVDAGCGSGILALSAALLGCGAVAGFDNDPEAIRVSLENADLNGLGGRVRFEVAGLPEGLEGPPAGVVMANIQSDVLVRFVDVLLAAVAPGGLLVLSGILAGEADTVRSAFGARAPGWPVESRALGEWCDVCLRRPA